MSLLSLNSSMNDSMVDSLKDVSLKEEKFDEKKVLNDNIQQNGKSYLNTYFRKLEGKEFRNILLEDASAQKKLRESGSKKYSMMRVKNLYTSVDKDYNGYKK